MTTPTGSAAGTVKRYALADPRGEHLAGWWSIKIGMTVSGAGEYVLATDYDALAAERDALKARVAELEAGVDAQVWFHLKMENHALKTQLTAAQSSEERLRKLESAILLAAARLDALSAEAGRYMPSFSHQCDKTCKDLREAALSTHPSIRP